MLTYPYHHTANTQEISYLYSIDDQWLYKQTQGDEGADINAIKTVELIDKRLQKSVNSALFLTSNGHFTLYFCQSNKLNDPVRIGVSIFLSLIGVEPY